MMSVRRTPVQMIRVVRAPGSRVRGLLLIGRHVLPCMLGTGSITRFKHEGDGATPAGRMALLALRFRLDRWPRPPGQFAAIPIRADDGWCDDPCDGRYNRPVPLPFAASHERLWRDDYVYDLVGILDWNISRRTIGRGSAIFLHLTRPERSPTAGCIALDEHHMRQLLRLMRPGAVFVIG
jgi:L,D-peptidoglycan transpeptidase YkuD (ErfK/YbiS/YcfS/YnhG family)